MAYSRIQFYSENVEIYRGYTYLPVAISFHNVVNGMSKHACTKAIKAPFLLLPPRHAVMHWKGEAANLLAG